MHTSFDFIDDTAFLAKNKIEEAKDKVESVT